MGKQSEVPCLRHEAEYKRLITCVTDIDKTLEEIFKKYQRHSEEQTKQKKTKRHADPVSFDN